MLTYAARRILGAIPTILLIIAIAFFMMRFAPGGPFSSERVIPEEILANLNKVYHLDEPLWMQFARYLWGLLHLDFGPSFRYKDYSVTELIANGLPYTATIGASALVISASIGCTLGAIAALRQNTRTDYGIMSVAMIGICIPNFVVAPILTLFFGVYLGLLPVAGVGTPWHLVLPVVALGLRYVAYTARLTRGSMIEVLRSNFIRTARAKGLPERVMLWRHALRAGLMPVVSYLGPTAAFLLTGSIVIEQIFALPGIGRYFIQGALNRDYTLVLGVVVLFGTLVVLFNLIVDLLYGWLDPRVRFD